jgi:alkane 1-monooxygenase
MFSRYSDLAAFVLPLTTFGFLNSGQHGITGVLVWTLPFSLVLLVDWLSPSLPYQPSVRHQTAYYDGILYLLSCLQFGNIGCMVVYISHLSWEDAGSIWISIVNLVAIRFLVGTSSGTSGIVVAHELIHRRQVFKQQIGRLLLCTVCYEHFVIAHKRGHHLNLGLPDDIATARLGESFKAYWRRVYWGYFRYAWQSEQERLAVNSGKLGILANQVLQGVVAELLLLTAILYYFGWLAGFMFLYQGLAAVRILEAVNYFQHWGLENGRFGKTFGWVTHSWLSRFALIGLSHHIGHHEDENRPYHEIAYSEQGPKLPYGYFVMNLWVKLHNPSYQQRAISELEKFKKITASR